MSHKHVVLGGTFDRLHNGHISYLNTAFENSERVTIGLTTDKVHRDKELGTIIQTYNSRKSELLRIINDKWPKVPTTILPIDDIFGPSITDPTMDTIVVTDMTLENGNKVNSERKKRGLNELKIVMSAIVGAQDSQILSSSRIRRGEIDRQGKVYNQSISRTLTLPKNLRPELRKPLGTVIKGDEDDKDKVASEVIKLLEKEKHTLSITVGDIVSSTLENAGFLPDIKIIDFKTQREFLPSFSGSERFDAENIAGTIGSVPVKHLGKEIEKIIKNKTVPAGRQAKKTITIDGEEDLLVLPVILLVPLESIVFYGQRDVGMVMVRVTEEIKKQVADLISKFA